jgi:uncharacterized membrane protein
MVIDRAGLAERLRSFAMTLLGVVLSFVPLGLWFAWTEAMLLAVVVVAVVSAGLIVLLSELQGPAADELEALRQRAAREALTDEAVAEMHQLFPLTYHHGRRHTPRFQRAMEKVVRLVGRPGVSDR